MNPRRIAILSAGPSLTRTWRERHRASFAMTIAVNRALKVVDADWLVAGDACVFACLGDRRPRDGFVTFRDAIIDPIAWPHRRDWTLRHFGFLNRRDWQELIPLFARSEAPNAPDPMQWSIQAAITLAVRHLADVIEIFGHDATTAPDVSGDPGEDRTRERWAREARDLTATIAAVRERGISVCFHLDPQAPTESLPC
jgi:hypothetical protein